MSNIEMLKQFIFNGLLTEDSFTRLDKEGISVQLGTSIQPITRIEESDFSPRIRFEANKMSSVYIAFFCLENAVRELIVDRLAERHGVNWWEECVSDKIRTAVEKLRDKEEKNRYLSPRSTSPIGYTMFGQLAQLVINNWDDFSDLFPNQAWITSRFGDLEMSRNIIMHSGVLPESEIERIESIVRDWLRQVG